METFSNPEKEYVYQMFSYYYDDPEMRKIKDDGKFSVYMIRLPCMLLNEQRYLIAVIARDQFPPFYQQKLSQLRWVSLQVRNLEEDYGLPVQSYNMKRTSEFQRRVRVLSRNTDVTTYKVDDLPLHVSLLHKRDLEYEYPDEGSLLSSLETFRTIIQFNF